ncbi:MAG TPA: hypothetical protein VFG30_42585 [Polyangiales bacterium]|nr:hypothetical protein [Polyangiales bacterium]
MAASDTSAFSPMLDHQATEVMLRQSGLAWTALRNGFYATSGLALMGNVRETGVSKRRPTARCRGQRMQTWLKLPRSFSRKKAVTTALLRRSQLRNHSLSLISGK